MNATQEATVKEILGKWREKREHHHNRPLERTGGNDRRVWDEDVIAEAREEDVIAVATGGLISRTTYLQTLELIDLLECIVFDRLGNFRSGCCMDKSNHVIISRKENIHTELIRDIQYVVEIKHSVLTEQYKILETE